ncbi:competence protein CoiA family protein [Anaerotignum propionicum]|uniref:competence protein CoiA family protein n=1 Tax=Anaerotignum propionicum TaxID=28446 RepID=UPI0028A1F9BE|nr:competence protein CoiA family protein [Anaerotignum propionicum]
MDKAIDRRVSGIENEINIKDFIGYHKSGSLFCPDCGEEVFPKRGNKNIHHFSHYKKTPVSIECENRAKKGIGTSFYERVGLPIYLINEDNKFSLGIGFYALGSSLLEKAQNDNLSVAIESESNYDPQKDKYLIDFTFYENDVTIKPINFIPNYGRNYSIKIPNDKSYVAQAINTKWSDYADGFSHSGAVFTYSEFRGKKIRNNDTITTNTEYFLVTFDRFFQIPEGIEKKYVNSFKVGQRTCHINKIQIKPSNEKAFHKHENYFWENFKLKLLYNKPNLVQMWPPAIKTDDTNYTIPLKSQNNSFIKVNSSLDIPKVYKYLERQYNEMHIVEDHNHCRYVKLPTYKGITPLSIDRKYLANAQMFCTDILFDTTNTLKVDINNTDIFSTDSIERIDLWLKEHISLNNNIKVDMIQVLNDNSILKESFNTSGTHVIELDSESTSVGLYYQKLGRFLCNYHKPKNKWVLPHVVFDFKRILRELDTPCIDVPTKYKNINSKVKEIPQINKLIRSFLIDGKIPVGILKVLVDGGLFNE